MLFLIYNALFKLYSVILKIKHPQILDVWYRNSLKLGYWSFGKSDIDVTILLKTSNSTLIRDINFTHLKIKKYLPVIGEAVFFSENLKEVLLKTINSLELKRDPVLMKKFSIEKVETLADRTLFLHKFLISNLSNFKKLERRNKKSEYLMKSVQIKLEHFNEKEIVTQLSILSGNKSEEFVKEYFYFLNTTIYPGSKTPAIGAIYGLFFNKICFLYFSDKLSELDLMLLESNVLWEFWGCYSNQTHENEEQIKKHIENILNSIKNLYPEKKFKELKEIVMALELLN